MKRHAGRPRPWPHCDSGPLPPHGHIHPFLQFLAYICCGEMALLIKMPLGMQVRLDPSDIVLDGDPAPSPKRTEPQVFGPYLLCPNGLMDQDATLYGGRLRPKRHCVRCGPMQLHRQGAQTPSFGLCLLWPNGWMDQDATLYEGRPRFRPHCVTWGPSSPPRRGTAPPQFSAHAYCGQTVAHPSYC